MFAAKIYKSCSLARTCCLLRSPQLIVTRSANREAVHQTLRNKLPPTQRHFLHRLGLLIGPVAFTGAVWTGTLYLANHVQPQSDATDSQRDVQKIVFGFIITNFAVFLMWKTGKGVVVKSILKNYMMSDVYHSSVFARSFSMLGSMFSHQKPAHFISTASLLPIIASFTDDPFVFLHLYISGGLTATLGSYIFFVVQPGLAQKTVGATAALITLLGYAIGKDPEARFSMPYINDFIPHSVWLPGIYWYITGFTFCALSVFPTISVNYFAHLTAIIHGHIVGMDKRVELAFKGLLDSFES